MPTFWRVFIINGCWIFQKLILHVLRCFYIFPFILLIWYITLIDFHMLNHACIPWINSTWCMILLMCCQIQFLSILLRISVSIFIRNISLLVFVVILLLIVFFSWLWQQGNVGLIKWVWKCSTSSNLGRFRERLMLTFL